MLIVKRPSVCKRVDKSMKVGDPPPSSAASRRVAAVSSSAWPAIIGSFVRPSDDDMPVSFTSAALSVGGVVSVAPAASRVTVSAAVAVLPARSVAVSSKALAPSVSAMPAKL